MMLLTLTTTLAIALGGIKASGQTPTDTAMTCGPDRILLGSIRLPRPVLADGKRLSAGAYQVRLTNAQPTPVLGQSPGGACWVEFVRSSTLAGRELATVISSREIDQIAEGSKPGPHESRVDVLKGGDYIRVWIEHGGAHYIINMPSAG